LKSSWEGLFLRDAAFGASPAGRATHLMPAYLGKKAIQDVRSRMTFRRSYNSKRRKFLGFKINDVRGYELFKKTMITRIQVEHTSNITRTHNSNTTRIQVEHTSNITRTHNSNTTRIQVEHTSNITRIHNSNTTRIQVEHTSNITRIHNSNTTRIQVEYTSNKIRKKPSTNQRIRRLRRRCP